MRSKNTTALWHGTPHPVSLAVVYIDEEAVASDSGPLVAVYDAPSSKG